MMQRHHCGGINFMKRLYAFVLDPFKLPHFFSEQEQATVDARVCIYPNCITYSLPLGRLPRVIQADLYNSA